MKSKNKFLILVFVIVIIFNQSLLINCASLCPEGFKDILDGTNTAISIIDDSQLYSPFQCGLKSTSATYVKDGDKTALKITLDNEGCPTDCKSYDYSCGEAGSLEKLAYGSYSCIMKTSNVPGAVSTCYASNNGKDIAYSEIYFRVLGNRSEVTIGCISQEIKFEKTVKLLGYAQEEYNTFTFNYTNSEITWKINQNLIADKKLNWAGDNSIPKPPLVLYTAIYNDITKSVKNSSLPTSLFIDSMAYTPFCYNDSSESSGNSNDWHWEPTSPLWYFTTNCTLWRPEWVYNDTFVEPWEDQSYSFRKIGDAAARKRGEVGISFDLKENTGIYFKSDKPFEITKHKFLTFWVNGATLGNQQMIIYFIGLNRTKVASLNLGEYVRGGLKPMKWYKVILPLKNLQINPPETKFFTGFLFSEAYEAYMGQMYVDDLFFSNGSICLNREKSVAYYKDGRLVGGGVGNYSEGSVDFASRGQLFRNKASIEWRVMSSNKLKLAFENGTINTSKFDGLLITVMFVPDNQYQWNGEASDEPHTQPPNEVQAKLQVQIDFNFYEGVGLSEYIGGEFPSRKWIDLTIPFYDLSCGEDQEVQALQLTSDEYRYQGVLYIGRIEAVKFADPPKESEDSFAFKLNSSIILLFSLIVSSILLK